jgi:hypothetical protein
MFVLSRSKASLVRPFRSAELVLSLRSFKPLKTLKPFCPLISGIFDLNEFAAGERLNDLNDLNVWDFSHRMELDTM